ncbi:MAG: TolB family protein [Phycisphaerae bacterium]
MHTKGGPVLRGARIVSVFVLAASGAAWGAPIKLNGPSTHASAVGRYMQLSPDGQHVVFTADTDAGDTAALFSVSISGGPATQLWGSTYLDGNYDPKGFTSRGHGPTITPDSQYVVFTSEPGLGQVSLWRAPIGGGAALDLADVQTDNVKAFAYLLTPDGQSVAYLRVAGTVQFLNAVPSGGGSSPVQLLSDPLENYGVMQYALRMSPDIARIAVTYNETIRTIPVGGGLPVTLTGSVPENWYVNPPKFTPDGSRVIFDANSGSSGGYTYFRTYSVPSSGGASTVLLQSIGGPGPKTTGLSSGSYGFIGSSAILYGLPRTSGTAGTYEFQSLPLDGSAPSTLGIVTIDQTLSYGTGATMHGMEGFVIMATGTSNSATDLLHMPFSGPSPTLLANITPGQLTPSFTAIRATRISNDDKMCVYSFFDSAGQLEIWSVPIAGGTPVQLSQPAPAGSYIYTFQLTPDGSYVIYTTSTTPRIGGGGGQGLWAVDIHGGQVFPLSDPLEPGDRILWEGTMAPDGTDVYWVGNDTDGYDLYSSAVPEPGTIAILGCSAVAILARRRARWTDHLA